MLGKIILKCLMEPGGDVVKQTRDNKKKVITPWKELRVILDKGMEQSAHAISFNSPLINFFTNYDPETIG